jgi:hypothetical protein
MSLWRAPIDVPENAQRRETVLYGPHGEPIVVKEPRVVGFRPPDKPPEDDHRTPEPRETT